MADLPVVAVLTAKPGKEADLQAMLASIVAPTRTEEGCLSYDLYVSSVDPTVFVTVESWRAQADLDAHLKTPHVTGALAGAGEVLAAAPQIHPLTPLDVS